MPVVERIGTTTCAATAITSSWKATRAPSTARRRQRAAGRHRSSATAPAATHTISAGSG